MQPDSPFLPGEVPTQSEVVFVLIVLAVAVVLFIRQERGLWR